MRLEPTRFLMRLLYLLLIVLTTSPAFGQQQRFTNTYVSIQYTGTRSDLTKGNNPWGIGTGLQTYFNVSPWLRPTIEITGDVYLENDKVLRATRDWQHLPTVTSIAKVLAGPSLQFGVYCNAGCIAGPSFVNQKVLFTIKPSFSLFLNSRQAAFLKASYIHVYNRGKVIKRDFTSFSLGFGCKVF